MNWKFVAIGLLLLASLATADSIVTNGKDTLQTNDFGINGTVNGQTFVMKISSPESAVVKSQVASDVYWQPTKTVTEQQCDLNGKNCQTVSRKVLITNGFKFNSSVLLGLQVKQLFLDFNVSSGLEQIGTGIWRTPVSVKRTNELGVLATYTDFDVLNVGDVILAAQACGATVNETAANPKFFNGTLRLTLSFALPTLQTCLLDPTITHQSSTQFSNGAGNSTIFNNDSESVYANWYAGNNSFTPSGTYFSQALILNRTANNGSINTVNWTWFEAPAVFTASNESVVLDLHFENDTKDASRFNNSAGGISGNTSAGMLTANCIIGSCYTFDGTNDFVNGSAGTFIPSGVSQLTISVWARARVAAASKIVAGWYDGTNGIFIQSSINATEGITFLAGSGGDYGVIPNPTTNWAHLVLVYDGSLTGNANRLKGYINGSQVTLGIAGTIPAILPVQTLTYKIGEAGTLGRYWDGSIDEVHIFNRSLAATEVQQLYGQERLGGKGNAGFIQNTTNVSLAFRTKNYTFNDTGLVGWWDLGDSSDNETQVNRTLDLSGNNQIGQFSGNKSVAVTTRGIIGNAAFFNNTDVDSSYIRITHTALHDTYPALTIAYWTNITFPSVAVVTLSKHTTSPNTGWVLAVDQTGLPSFQLRVNNTCCQTLNGNTTVAENKWTHIAQTWDNTTGMRIYINGTLTGSLAGTGGNLLSTIDIGIGANILAQTARINFSVDDIKIWNRSLSGAEIAALYNSGNPSGAGGQESNWTAFSSEFYSGNATVTKVVGAIGQYRASLNSTNTNYSAFLQNVSINYDGIVTSGDSQAPTYSANTSLVPTVYADGFQTWFNTTWVDDTSIANVTFGFDGVNFTPTNGSSNVYFLRLNGVSAGIHYWQTFAQDAAANHNETGNTTFTVARAPVNVTVFYNMSPVNRTLTNNIFNFTATKNASEGTIELLYNITGLANIVLNLSTTNTSNYSFYNWTNSSGFLLTARFNQTQNYSAASRAMQATQNTTPNFTAIQSPQINDGLSAFNFTFNDDVELLSWIFSTNYTDNWMNDSLNITTGLNATNITIIRDNAHRGTNFWYGWRVYGNDTLGNFIDSGEVMALISDPNAVPGQQGGTQGNVSQQPPAPTPPPQTGYDAWTNQLFIFIRLRLQELDAFARSKAYNYPQLWGLLAALALIAYVDNNEKQSDYKIRNAAILSLVLLAAFYWRVLAETA